MHTRALIFALVFIPQLVLAAENGPLKEARARADDLDYPAALKLLDAALAVEGNERETLLEIYELQGVCWATLGKADKAREVFRALAVLDPEHALSGAQPPRVKTPFYEAKEWAARAGPLRLTVEPQKSGDQVVSVTATVPPDGLGLARAIALHVEVNGVRRNEQVTLDASTRSATAKVGASAYSWWAEVLGEGTTVLLRRGTAEAPNVVEAPKADVPTAVRLAPQQVEARPEAGTGQRVAGVVVGVAGLGSLGAGVALGALSSSARTQIAEATRDADGNVIGITQRKAADLDAQARDFGAAANVLMIGGGVVAAVGTLLVIFAPTEDVAVAPAPGGAVVSGKF